MPPAPNTDSEGKPSTPDNGKSKTPNSRFLGLTYSLSRAIIHDEPMRRNTMMWLVMSAVVMLFVGAIVIDGWLQAHPALFVLFWLICAWLTVASILMAIFDMLIQVAKARARNRVLKKEILVKELERMKEERAREAED